ncbi:MAG: diguanylate cyclase [Betaproteobacteria bacterium]
MKSREHFLQRTFVTGLVVFVVSMLGITSYTLWLHRAEALSRGFEVSAMHAQNIEDLLTQNLHVTELIAANTLVQTSGMQDSKQVLNSFAATLSRSPFLRSMSLLDDRGRITISSNPANVGIIVPTEDYLPPAMGLTENLRIGETWSGRDFASGRAASSQNPVERDALSFIPVIQTRVSGGRKLTLLLAFNTDYFVNRVSLQLGAADGVIEVLRYDGSLMISSCPDMLPASRQAYVARDLKLSENEFGQFAQDYDKGRKVLTAFRASRLYPFVVVTHLDREYALKHWVSEAQTLLGVVALVLASITWLAFAYFRRQLQLSAQRAESERLQRINATVFDSSAEAILITDMESTIISVNPAFTRVTGYEASEILGHHLSEFLSAASALIFAEHVFERHDAARNGTQTVDASIEGQLVCRDGHLIWTEILSTPERDLKGSIVGFHRICRNISERKRMEDQVRQLAFYDPLTQLPNRRLFDDRLRQVLASSKRTGFYGALIFLDLDNFKPLNDTHGHRVGDLLLIEVAGRMRNCVREIDTVARFGGDEFVVALGALSADRKESALLAGGIAEKIRNALSEPYRLRVSGEDGSTHVVQHCCTSSIGVAVFSGQEHSQDEILNQADAAMYQAKEEGRNRVCFYTGSSGFVLE